MNATLPPPKATLPPKKVAVIRARCDATCDDAGMSTTDREALRARQFLNPYAFEGY